MVSCSLQACYSNLDAQTDGVPMHQILKFEFPKLTGEYPVSKTTRHIIDTNRKEPFNPNEQRELMVHIWYPSARGEVYPYVVYRQDEIADTKRSLIANGFPEEDVKNLDFIYTHAVADEQPLHGLSPYPVILFSHGYLGLMPEDYTALCEELASHGYIVASVAHTYYAPRVIFPDGRIITAAPELYFQQSCPSADEQRMWADDVQCALDHLLQYNADTHNTFFNLLDPERVGVIGHSMGGSTAYRLCTEDSRFKAGVSFDALLWSTDQKVSELTKPFLFMFAEQDPHTSDEKLAQYYGRYISYVKIFENVSTGAEQVKKDMRTTNEERAKNHEMYLSIVKNFQVICQKEARVDVVIPGLMHSGFSDLLLLKDLPVYKNNKQLVDVEAITGTAKGKETIQLINKHIVDFLDAHLKQE
mgnify:CR=1 FL=1